MKNHSKRETDSHRIDLQVQREEGNPLGGGGAWINIGPVTPTLCFASHFLGRYYFGLARPSPTLQSSPSLCPIHPTAKGKPALRVKTGVPKIETKSVL